MDLQEHLNQRLYGSSFATDDGGKARNPQVTTNQRRVAVVTTGEQPKTCIGIHSCVFAARRSAEESIFHQGENKAPTMNSKATSSRCEIQSASASAVVGLSCLLCIFFMFSVEATRKGYVPHKSRRQLEDGPHQGAIRASWLETTGRVSPFSQG